MSKSSVWGRVEPEIVCDPRGPEILRMRTYGTGVLRMAPPSNISQKQLYSAMGILEKR